MPTTIREYRLVKGMTRIDALTAVGEAYRNAPKGALTGLLFLVQDTRHMDRAFDTYSYEVHNLRTAIACIMDTPAFDDSRYLVRVEWV
jgi:hypothetical protein